MTQSERDKDREAEGVRRGLMREAPDGTSGWSMGDAMRKIFSVGRQVRNGPFPWSKIFLLLVGLGVFFGYKYGVATSSLPGSSRPEAFAIVGGVGLALLYGVVRAPLMTILLIGLAAFVLQIGFGISLLDVLRRFF